ncbi:MULTISPECIES: hypothetical protein [Pseudomonas]|uniref:hypothetical protein n=1 Tax=Pseudomonas TaxID=286 RepID=UPI00070D93C5|nr:MULTISPECIES: hypothetical protein [Pseudomonas]KQW19737.1 hypothetical protein ASC85_07750 [Pseudomonas sp. Root401]WHS57311.1 hypothetical protein QLH64_30305 [Pseudomonas brassicacearum]
MNNKRRKRIAEICAQIETLKAQLENANSLKDEIEVLQGEEQESFDNLPESLQQGDKGQAMEQAVEALEEAAEQLENGLSAAIDALDEVLASLGNSSNGS